MADDSYLRWPFFDDSHRELARQLRGWCEVNPELFHQPHSLPLDEACRRIVSTLGKAGWLRYVVPRAYGGIHDTMDVRSICIIRETLAQRSGLVEFCFAMQGLGMGPVSLFGSEVLKKKVLPGIAAGQKIGAFAI